MRVSIIGAGYVGLVSGACLAEKGHSVICVDVDPARVEMIGRGEAPIHEVGLTELLGKHVGKNLHATTDLRAAVLETDMTLICVGTPFDGQQIDLTFIRESARQIGEALRDKSEYHLVVVKSTVVPGTTDDIVLPTVAKASGKLPGRDFGVGMNPEFLTEGQAIADFMQPDRIVLGARDAPGLALLEQLYAEFPAEVPRVRTNPKTAEMIKYVSNSLLATMISLSNEVANLCTALGGVDVAEVMHGVHLSNYLSPQTAAGRVTAPIASFLQAGCGFGGSCLPKDVKALVSHGEQLGVRMPLLRAVIDVNERQPKEVLGLLARHFDSLDNVAVTVLGLAFKPDTDDVRESPAIEIIRSLQSAGARVSAYDPIANAPMHRVLDDPAIQYHADARAAVADAEAVVLVTRWQEFEHLPALLDELADPPVLVDGRRMLQADSVARYEGIGLRK